MSQGKGEHDRLREATRTVFERRAKRPLSDEDLREIAGNLCGFFTALSEWAEADRSAGAGDPAGEAEVD